MYEGKHQPVISRGRFALRMLLHVLVVLAVAVVSLGMGIVGLKYFEHQPFHQAFMHASLMLSGYGIPAKLETTPGHWFVGCYALYSGLFFIVSVGVIITPIIHRILHRFHWDDAD